MTATVVICHSPWLRILFIASTGLKKLILSSSKILLVLEKSYKLLAQKKTLLVPDNRTALFASPAVVISPVLTVLPAGLFLSLVGNSELKKSVWRSSDVLAKKPRLHSKYGVSCPRFVL